MASVFVQEGLAQEVDSSRIGLWGTSFAGGHVLVKGAEMADDWRIRAIVSQAGRPRCWAAGRKCDCVHKKQAVVQALTAHPLQGGLDLWFCMQANMPIALKECFLPCCRVGLLLKGVCCTSVAGGDPITCATR